MSYKPAYEGNDTDIAIIGLSIRVPGADTVNQFWNHIKNGNEVVADLSSLSGEDRSRSSEYGGHFIATNTNIKDIENFDALFFDFSPRDASLMDPQHRLFLECAWEALEGAGYDPRSYKGLTGLYAGVYANYYSLFNLLPFLRSSEAASEIQMQIANEKDHLATMAAYKLDLTGPVMNVQSACSTSLAAIHMACESLLTYSSDMMICGAATLSIPQSHGYFYQDNGLLSSDGHLRAFDANAEGTIYSDGAGCVVLKRLRDAWEDGDIVHAVIKGSALNNDGSARVGYSAPGVKGQVQVIERAQLVAGIDPESITYIETHGTGTPLGDAIELEALHEVFGKVTEKRAFCALGSVKPNYGHAGPASGVIGLIKTVMALKEKMLPPSINVEIPNDRLMMANSPFYLNTLLSEWTNSRGPRCAAVSSFGLGGTNVHVILEEAPASKPTELSRRRCKLLVFSARSATALREQSLRLKEALHPVTETELADAAYTLLMGRRLFEHRGFYLCHSAADLALPEEKGGARLISRYRNKPPRKLVFLFSNPLPTQRSVVESWMEQEPFFSDKLEDCLEAAKQACSFKGSAWELLNRQEPELQVISNFAVQYALSQLWKQWGISPELCYGRGMGAITAACVSGLFSLDDALALCVRYVRVHEASWENREEAMRKYNEYVQQVRYLQPTIAFKTSLLSENKENSDWRGSSFWIEYLRQSIDEGEPQECDTPCEDAEQIMLEMSLNPLSLTENIETTKEGTELEGIYHMLGMLWMEGYPVNWEAYYAQEYRRRIMLPTYPFERKRYWVDEEPMAFAPLTQAQLAQPSIQLEPEQLTGYVSPQNENERQLVLLWESFLGVTPIGVEDNYYELGGNSLLAVSLREQICKKFNVDMGLEVFFEQQTISNLAKAIESYRINSIV